MAAPIPIPANISSITASLLLGTLFNYGLYGILTAQVFLYALSFPKDQRHIKILVYSVYFIETLQVALSTADAYYWFASGYGNFPRLDNIYISAFDTPMMCGLVSFIVQSWLCYRIWVLRKEWLWWSGLIFLISATQASAAFAGGAKGHISGHFSGSHDFIELIYMWFIGSATADILIAGTMAYLLLQARAKDNSPLDGILVKLVTLVMETNALTAGVALLSLTIFLGAPKENWFTCPIMIIGKLYSNTLMVSFNNRLFLRVDKAKLGSVNFANSSFQRRSGAAVENWHVRSHNPDEGTVSPRSGNDVHTIKSLHDPGAQNHMKLKRFEEFSEE